MSVYTVVIPWADRAQLESALADNAAFFEPHRPEVLVINGGGDRDQLDGMLRRTRVPNVTVLDVPHTPFNKSLCLNLGATAASGRYLFLLDADIVLKSDVLADARAHLDHGGRFVAIRSICESTVEPPKRPGPDLSFLRECCDTRELLTVDGRRAVLKNRSSPTGLRGGDGIVLLRRDDMLQVGGMNSALAGWGYEDTDFQIRLQFMLGLERVEVGDVIHLSHDSVARDRQSWEQNMLACTRNYCLGRYLGTLADDTAKWPRVPAAAGDVRG